MIDGDGVRGRVRLLLALGEDDYEAIAADAAESLDGAPGADGVARDVTADEFAAYLADQRTWPETIASDRVLRAFRDLDLAGIVARVDHGCCQNCGIAEIGGEVPDGEQHAYRGYAFSHRQDMENAVDGGGLTIAYGVFNDAQMQADQAGIGREVAAALQRHGLDVQWSGDPGERIEVPLTWRRRRFGGLAAGPGEPAPEPPAGDRVDVTFCDYHRGRHADDDVPMTLAGAKDVLAALTPWKDNFAVFEGLSGGVLQVCWEEGRRLWLERPDAEARCSHGRYATPSEVEDLLAVLAREGDVAVGLLGDVAVDHWDG
ncbi:DUF6891 domain-containing protein [Actinomadura violacea]|uniref:DUF6891 domain-containing protein n=1 Tax=Actinomadura violacea TaxID=2819934 RepID=A0ABS3RRU1_9ACTN|nr:hypothetical protein [Actinomadura violacea]MBO2459351.1 hypothetical protein [Actinomadura violacea]